MASLCNNTGADRSNEVTLCDPARQNYVTWATLQTNKRTNKQAPVPKTENTPQGTEK